MKLKTCILNVLLCLVLAAPAWAASKSATIRVSCTIPAQVELSAPSFGTMQARSNLDELTQMTEDFRDRSGGRVKLYSLTAL